MKTTISFAVVLGVLVSLSIAASPSEDKRKIVEDCKAMEKPTEEEVQQFMNKSPQSPAAKCFGACVYEKSGAIRDGKINPDGLKMCILKNHGGAEKIGSVVNAIVADCQSLAAPERCELALRLSECLGKSFAAHPH